MIDNLLRGLNLDIQPVSKGLSDLLNLISELLDLLLGLLGRLGKVLRKVCNRLHLHAFVLDGLAEDHLELPLVLPKLHASAINGFLDLSQDSGFGVINLLRLHAQDSLEILLELLELAVNLLERVLTLLINLLPEQRIQALQLLDLIWQFLVHLLVCLLDEIIRCLLVLSDVELCLL